MQALDAAGPLARQKLRDRRWAGTPGARGQPGRGTWSRDSKLSASESEERPESGSGLG